MKRWAFGLVALLTAVSVATTAVAQTKVVATTGMIADTARAIGGDRADVDALMGPGVDPHAFRQTRSDIVALTQADLVLWNGLFLEAQMEEFLLGLGARKPVVAVAETISAERLIAHDDYDGLADPHVWMDPGLWAEVARVVHDALVEVDPDGAGLYAANLERYTEELVDLSRYADRVLGTVPPSARMLVTAHDAFNYFGTRHGFEVMGIQGISTESEAGLRKIEALVALLVERDVRAVFVETSVSDRNIRALIEGAAARGHDVNIGGELYSDAMGPSGSYEGTYLGMIDHNASTIAAALGGDVPTRGRLGQLSGGTGG